MADPALTEGTLYVNRDRDFRTGEIGPYVKLGVVRRERESSARNLEHQTGNPREIITLHELFSPMVDNLETQLHNRFASYWVHGEWFEMDDEFVKTEVLPLAERIISQQKESFSDFEAKLIQKAVVSSDMVRKATDEEKEVAEKCFAAREALIQAKSLKDFIDSQIRIMVGTDNGIEGIVNLSYKKGPTSFDKKKFLEENDELAKQYFEEREDKLSGSIILAKGKSLNDLNDIADEKIKEKKKEIPKFSWKSKGKKAKSRDDSSLILHAAYVNSMKAVAEADWEFERQKARLVKLLGEDKGIEGIITYNRTIKTQEPAFNASKFKEENPELHASYLKEGKETVAVKIQTYRAYSPTEIDFSKYSKTIYD
tara:strand:- start:29 stop:1135 length:1107 start_codon:yes stop_codon:yes gene_type:complete